MKSVYAIIDLILLTLLVIRQIKVWKARVFLSPGFYFGIMWFLGVFGLLTFSITGLFTEVYSEYIDELNILIGFTALCFLLFTNRGRDKINEQVVDADFINWRVFKLLSVIFFIAALIDFVRLGGNLNMGMAREKVHLIQESRPLWISYIETLSVPLSIWAGYKIILLPKSRYKQKIIRVIFLCIPLFGNLIFSINVGGRVDFVFAFAAYMAGVAFGIPISQTFKRNLKPLLIISGSSLVVLIFISYVASQRASYYKGSISDTENYFNNKYPVLSFLYGPIEYVQTTYIGYQYRRVDAVDLEHLGYGQYTFNGFINWTLPFSNQLGLGDASIAKVFDIYYHNQETYDYIRPAYNSTHSCYLTMIKDYGVVGSFVCVFFLALVAHDLFVNIQKRSKIKSACSLYVFFLFWNYWTHSNFYGTLSSSVLINLYGFLIIDFFVFILPFRIKV